MDTTPTIRELSEFLGISRQALEKQVVKLDSNLLDINKKGAKIILPAGLIELSCRYELLADFLNEDVLKEEDKEATKEDNLLAILVAQMQTKDDQINQLQKLLENQQILTLKAQDKIELLEENGLSEEKDKGNRENKEGEKSQKGFFYRLFK